MNLRISIAIILWTLISCTPEPVDQEPDITSDGAPSELDAAFTFPETELETFSGWARHLLFFDEEDCVYATEEWTLEGFSPDFTAGSCVAVAYEDSENLIVPSFDTGREDRCFKLNSATKDAPGIYTKVCSGGLSGLTGGALTPAVSYIRVKISNAPADFLSFDFRISGLSNTFDFMTGEYSFEGSGYDFRNVSLRSQDTLMTFFPQINPAGEPVEFTVRMEGYEKNFYSTIANGLKPGTSVELELDFYQSGNELKAGLTARSYVNGESDTSSETSVTVTEYRRRSSMYSVEVQQKDGTWKKEDVHYALCSDATSHHSQLWNDWDNSKKLRDTMGFTNFVNPFDGPVKVRVHRLDGKQFSRVDIRPTEYGIIHTEIDDNTIEFTIPSYEKRKLSIEFDSDRFHNLAVLPCRPDPDRPDPDNIPSDMIYFGPGEHVRSVTHIGEGQTLYVDEGAILYTKITVDGDNATIAGNGIISGEKLAHTGGTYASGYQLIESNPSKNGTRNYFTVKDVTIIDSPNWTMSIYNTDHVTIDNINLICWILNGDGIDLCSVRDAVVRDSFIRTYDDCITLKVNSTSVGDTQDILLENNLIWADYARGIVIGPESGCVGGGRIHDVTVEGCTVLHHPFAIQSNSQLADRDCCGISISQFPHGGTVSGTTENIIFRNIVSDNVMPQSRPFVIRQEPGQDGQALLKNITFENFRILAEKGSRPADIFTHGSRIEGLVFRNLTYNGAPFPYETMLDIYGDNVEYTVE